MFPGRRLGKPISNMPILNHLKQISRGDTISRSRLLQDVPNLGAGGNGFRAGDRRTLPAHITGDKAKKAYKRGKRQIGSREVRVPYLRIGGAISEVDFLLIGGLQGLRQIAMLCQARQTSGPVDRP